MTHGFNPPRRMDLVKCQPWSSDRTVSERRVRDKLRAELAEQIARPLIPEKQRVREYGA